MMESISSIIASVIVIIILLLVVSFGYAVYEKIVGEMWETIKKLIGENGVKYVSIITFIVLFVALLYGLIK